MTESSPEGDPSAVKSTSEPSSPVPCAQPVRASAATTMLVPAAAAPRRRTIICLLVGATGRTAGVRDATVVLDGVGVWLHRRRQ
ncbi:Uncharacterised protein [Mycobacteroides abscessus]|nr:Uncharacterised protein [Mycobacteroides abscessus]